jgi:hypothetical protein
MAFQRKRAGATRVINQFSGEIEAVVDSYQIIANHIAQPIRHLTSLRLFNCHFFPASNRQSNLGAPPLSEH